MKYLTILLALFVVLFLAGNSFFLVVIINCIVVGIIYPWWEEKYWNAPERVAKREKKREERERRKFEAVVSEYKVHIDKMLKDACDKVRQSEEEKRNWSLARMKKSYECELEREHGRIRYLEECVEKQKAEILRLLARRA